MTAEYQLYSILAAGVAFQVMTSRARNYTLQLVFLGIQLAVVYWLQLAALPTLLLTLALLGMTVAPLRLGGARLRSAGLWGFLGVWFLFKYAPTLLGYLNQAGAQTHLRNFLSLYSIAGLSFLGFKVIHFWLDRKHGKIERYEPVEVLSWLFFFPTFISGPIQRFEDWQMERARREPIRTSILAGIPRLVEGLFLKFVLADAIFDYSLASLNSAQIAQMHSGWLFVYALVYTLYLYFDFAGYSACAIGIARFWGIRLPENFNYPLLSRNLAEFWKRWHITLSDWLKEYLFYPLTMTIKRNPKLRKLPLVGIFLPPFLTFLLAGLWHGATAGYLIFGALHGLGLGIIAFQDQRLPSKNSVVRYWRTSWIGHGVGMVINYAYVSFTFVFFLLSNHDLNVLWHRVWGIR